MKSLAVAHRHRPNWFSGRTELARTGHGAGTATVPERVGGHTIQADCHTCDQARVMTIERLDVAVARTLDSGMSLREVLLVGHADRTGRHDTNQALAQARVQTVRDYLVAKGIPAAITRTSVQGDRQPVSACQGKYRSRAEALECLLPNRRVEVNFVALRQP